MLLRKIILSLFLITGLKTFAQKNYLPDSLRQFVLAARVHDGFIFAHNVHVQDTKGTHPDGFELEYSHLHTDVATAEKFKCFPRNGFSFTYINFNKTLLGRGYSLNYFLEPNYRLGNRLTLMLRGSVGLSYLTNPFDSIKNPTNQSYSGHINSLLQLNLGLKYPLTHHFALYASGNFFHNSNGDFKQPNSGVNYINASIGLQYYAYSTRLPAYKKQTDTSWRHHGFHYDAALYYSPKEGYNADSVLQKKFLMGTSFQMLKQVSVMDVVTAGAEVYYDGALRSVKRTFIFDSSSNILAGVLVGHQFLLNHFIFSQEFGFYVSKHTKLYDEVYRDHKVYHTTYQRWGVYYNLNKHWMAGINLLAHYQVADFVDARIIWRIK